jgi:hypothetical protein
MDSLVRLALIGQYGGMLIMLLDAIQKCPSLRHFAADPKGGYVVWAKNEFF